MAYSDPLDYISDRDIMKAKQDLNDRALSSLNIGNSIQTIDPYKYEPGTLVDAPLAAGAFPWLVAGGTALGYGAGQLDARGVPLLPDQTSYPMEGPMRLAGRGTGDAWSGPTSGHAQTIADLVAARTEDKAADNWWKRRSDKYTKGRDAYEASMDQGLKMALDDRGYPVITEGPYAGKNMVRRGIQDLHGPEAMIPHPEGITYEPYEMTGQDALQAEIAAYERQLEAELAADYQDAWRRGPLQTGRSITVSDDRTELQKWTDSFKRDWQAR